MCLVTRESLKIQCVLCPTISVLFQEAGHVPDGSSRAQSRRENEEEQNSIPVSLEGPGAIVISNSLLKATGSLRVVPATSPCISRRVPGRSESLPHIVNEETDSQGGSRMLPSSYGSKRTGLELEPKKAGAGI